MKKVFLIFASFVILYLTYRSIFCYRIIAFSNEGNLKYKESHVTYFPQPPLSIINPFKKQILLNKIRDYCESEEFEEYHSIKNYSALSHKDFFLYKKLSLSNLLLIKAAKDERNFFLILVTHKSDKDLELVFQLNRESNRVEGYY